MLQPPFFYKCAFLQCHLASLLGHLELWLQKAVDQTHLDNQLAALMNISFFITVM